ncbi:MAG: CmcJ/NvfI family oxidoreductase [Alphaproteobacteria bacterium]
MSVAEAEAQGAVTTAIKYVVAGEKSIFVPTDRAKSYWPVDEHKVRIENMRPITDKLSIDKNGFVLLREPTKVKNFYDPDEIKRVYYGEIEALVKRVTGAEKVLVWGEMVRSDKPQTGDGRLPAYGAHVDYGDRTVRDTTEVMLGKEEAAKWLKRRLFLINLWRPIKTVERTPLAVVDASTVLKSELNDSEVRGGLNDPGHRTLYGFNLQYSPRHRWYYAPRMQPDEILVFKLFDSDPSRVQLTAHTAFDDPTSPKDAAPRESVEVRTISFMPE